MVHFSVILIDNKNAKIRYTWWYVYLHIIYAFLQMYIGNITYDISCSINKDNIHNSTTQTIICMIYVHIYRSTLIWSSKPLTTINKLFQQKFINESHAPKLAKKAVWSIAKAQQRFGTTVLHQFQQCRRSKTVNTWRLSSSRQAKISISLENGANR